MGFIDWHGTKSDHYKDVVEYAETNEKLDVNLIRGAAKKRELAAFFGVPKWAELERDAVLKELRLMYRELAGILNRLMGGVSFPEGFEAKQFTADFWLYILAELLDQSRTPEDRKVKMLDVFISGVFQVGNRTTAGEHYRFIREESSYQEYLERCFAFRSGKNVLFWQWLGFLEEQTARKGELDLFQKSFWQFQLGLAFYLNQIMEGQTIGRRSVERRMLHETIIRNSLRANVDVDMLYGQLSNPLYQVVPQEVPEPKAEKAVVPVINAADLMKHIRIIARDMSYLGMGNVDEMKNAELLYQNFVENLIEKESIEPIFPADAARILAQGSLPEISAEEAGLETEEGERIHYMEHALLYQQVRKDHSFRPVSGTLYITDRRLYFHAGIRSVEVKFAVIDRVYLYDLIPEVLEVKAGRSGLLLRSADSEQSYRVLKLLMNLASESVESRTSVTTVALDYFERADLERYLFTLRQLGEADMPQEMKQTMDEMVVALESLKAALQNYPEEKEAAHRFLTYYIPEAIRVVFAYQEYGRAGVSEKRVVPVYDSVLQSVRRVKEAAEQKVDDIYRTAAMDTITKAKTLDKIIRQDGYTEQNETLKL